MTHSGKSHIYAPYYLMLGIYVIFIIFAFIFDSPAQIARGIRMIIMSRSILISDYVRLGGIGATLINAVVVGCASILLLIRGKILPNGALIMALWMTTGFAFFGKNIFNMIPIIFGVWLFAKYQKEPFSNYVLVSLLSATLCPVVSEIAFLGVFPIPLGVLYGVLLGIFTGFIFPSISAFTVKAHMGYCLYNLGFAGGLIATFIVSVMRSLDIYIFSEVIWSTGYNSIFAIFLYIISLILIVFGIYFSEKGTVLKRLLKINKQSGRLISDFYLAYNESVYVNMGILCALSTTIILILGADLNGATVGGIFTITGFGCFGKHPRNILPIMFGAVLSTYWNHWDPKSPANVLAILFSTGLAPIAGQFGWAWGIVAGFIHVNLANNVGAINSGLNLYNNGFAGGLVAMLLVPLILTFRRDNTEDEI